MPHVEYISIISNNVVILKAMIYYYLLFKIIVHFTVPSTLAIYTSCELSLRFFCQRIFYNMPSTI